MSKIEKTTFGRRLQMQRKAQNLSTGDLAERTGLSVAHIQHLEAGNRMPTLSSLLKFSNALNLNPSDLILPTSYDSLAVPTELMYSADEIYLICDIYESLLRRQALNYKQLVGERVRKIREDHGLTRNDLAGKLEISNAFVANIENGVTPLSIPLLQKLSEALKIDLNLFLCDVAPTAEALHLEGLERALRDSFNNNFVPNIDVSKVLNTVKNSLIADLE